MATPRLLRRLNAQRVLDALRAQGPMRVTELVSLTQLSRPTVDAVADTSIFGHSNYNLLSIPYANLRARMLADAKSHNDSVALGTGGSMTVADPTNGTGQYFLTRAQAKALGHLPDDMAEDGKTSFGAGFRFTFSAPPAGRPSTPWAWMARRTRA